MQPVLLAKAFRASGKDPSKVRPHRKLGQAGDGFAVEIENDRAPESVVQYVETRFDDLLEYFAPTIDAMAREGEIKPAVRDAAKGAEYRAAFEAAQRQREEAAGRQEVF
ncbi:hypothetical protein P3T18_005392 [Paraburkholderia sp. GAS199]|uniref:hypothetical protein n=1 Tax=Paraburkholderia sp. GAS199 TaxID=3035126 RepID=UPI003D2561E0